MQGNSELSRLEELARDRVSGAREILGRLLKLLKTQISDLPADADPLGLVVDVAGTLLVAQPTMAPLLSLFDDLFHAADDRGRSGVAESLSGWIDEHRRGLDDVVARAHQRLEGVSRVATLSWSSTVAGVLAECPRPLDVVVAESRPGAEGRRMAARLEAWGHRVVFVCDSAFPGLLHDVEVLLLGGDALTPFGQINKVGSIPAAREMRAGSGQVISIIDRTKVIGSELARRLRVHPEPPGLVWSDAPDGIQVESCLFELVPIDLLDEVVGPEVGGSPAQVLASVEARPASPHWSEVPTCEDAEPLRPAPGSSEPR